MTYLSGPDNDYRSLLEIPDPEPSMTVSVVMPVYNRVELLALTVAGLVGQTYPKHLWDVIVADDGSDEDVEAALAPLREHLPITIVRREHEGYGAGQARNLGGLTSTADILVFVDADCLPDADLVSRHASWHHKTANAVTIGSRTGVDTSHVSVDNLVTQGVPFAIDARGSDDFRQTFYRRTTNMRFGDEAYRSLVSSNFAIRRDFFLSVGGFDEGFHRWGGEDTELGWRLFEAGAYIIPEDRAAVFHQLQIDGEEGWREASRIENDGEIVTRIPHRFYRKSVPGRIYVAPKVTWIISPVIDERIERLWRAIGRQSLTDYETIWVGDSSGIIAFGEENQADPRISVVPSLADAVGAASGQYIATIHGWATPDHRLAARLVRRLDSRPRIGRATVGFHVVDAANTHTTESDVGAIDKAWESDGVPPFTFARRREWRKALLLHDEPSAVLDAFTSWTKSAHFGESLVAVPSATTDTDIAPDYPAYQSDRSRLIEELRTKPVQAVPTVGRFIASRVTDRPFQAPAQPARPANAASDAPPGRPHVRYVGWVGKENFGDEIMLDAVRDLLVPAEVVTSGEPRNLLLLGGGTLINRDIYLDWLHSKDSPRIERAVLGTGVANPSYWGIQEPTDQWLDFLSTCAYVGVRGPLSAETLVDWGMQAAPEIVGDPALLIERPTDADPTNEAIVTISPARTDGELHGDSDDIVFEGLANLTADLVADGREVHFLSCFPSDDRAIFEIMRSAGHPNLPYHSAYTDRVGAIRLLAESGLVVSERLHGAVVAAAVGTPFVALEYRPKVRDFCLSVGMGDYVLPTDRMSDLPSMFEQLVSDTASAAATMDSHVAEYRRRLRSAGDRILDSVS